MTETPEEGVSLGANAKFDLWTPYRDLYNNINKYLYQGIFDDTRPEAFYNLLLKHKQNFICLLQNPPKNPKSRDELKKGMEEGITIKEIGHQVISRDLYQEAIILSDMYELNEFVALDLLCTAQVQMSYHHGLPRGLVAVLLYYEGRKFIISSLKLLIQVRKGVLWSMNIRPELEKYTTMFTDQLLECGMFNRIFELLQTLDLTKEIEKLQENVALGGPKHQRQVIDLFNDTRLYLSEIVYLWAAQSGLPREPTLGLLGFLRQLQPDEDSLGVLDNVTILLLLAALYAFDLSILHFREDGEEIIQSLPLLADKEFITSVSAELAPSKTWIDKGIKSVIDLAFSLCTSGLRHIPQYEEPPTAANQTNFAETKVFDYLHLKVLPNDIIYSDEVITRRFHYLLTDFIVHMYTEVKHLQIRSQEVIQGSSEVHASLSAHLEQFMMCVAKFYSKDPANLHYCLEYWCPVETNLHDLYSYKTPPRTLVLYKYIKAEGESVSETSFVAYLDMLAGLSMHPQAARYCFNFLQSNSSTITKLLSWDHFFTSFNQYYNNLKQDVIHADTIYGRSQNKGIAPQEIKGLLAVLNLIKVIAEQDDFSRLALCEHPVWAPLSVLLGLVGCSVPIHFKASLIFTLGALSKSTEVAAQMWNYIEASQIIQTVPTTSRYQPLGIHTELEEVESRREEYPLTQSFLRMLDVLTDSGIPRALGAGPRQPGFDPYLTYLINSVFLKFMSRIYKDPTERWTIGCMCLKLFEKFLLSYEPQAIDFTSEFNRPPGYHIMLMLNSKSEFLNLLLFIIDEGQKLFAQYVSLPGQQAIEKCILNCLNVLERALKLQSVFVSLAAASPHPPLLTGLVKLLLFNNPRTGQPDHLISITKYVSYYSTFPAHTTKVLEILLHITRSPVTHSQYLNILLVFDKDSRAIRNGFVDCLDNAKTNSQELILKLLKQGLAYVTPNLGQFMLGFDLKSDVSQMIFQPTGIMNFPRTCLHSIFTIFKCTLNNNVEYSSQLLESSYEILYLLYSNSKTCDPVLRFTRLNPKFFEQHVVYCTRNVPQTLAPLSWLLRTVAIDIKISCDKMQILYLQPLVELLTNKPETFELNTREHNLLEHLVEIIPGNMSQVQAVNFVNALQQVIQVLALYLPFEIALPIKQYSTSIHLLRKVLESCVKNPFSPGDAKHLASTVMILIRNVVKCVNKIDFVTDHQLDDIFNGLLRWLMVSDAGCQHLRIHLYTSIITFLNMAYHPKTQTEHEPFFISRLDTSKLQVSHHPVAAKVPALVSKCGEHLIKLICQDCVGGHDVVKMLSMQTFSLLINTSGDNSWILFMVSQGYLNCIINEILKSDDDLKQLLQPNFKNLRVMYLFKAKFSLLSQIANSKIGAQHILEHKIFACLSNMNVLALHPEVVKQSDLLPELLQDFIPGADLRYLEVFLPVLELCIATVTCLSVDNFSVVTQILDFIVSQLNALEFVLRSGNPGLSEDFLCELATVTQMVSLVSRANVAFVVKIRETFQNYNIPMLRIQKHMLALLTKFVVNENVIQELLANPLQDGSKFQTSPRLLYTLQIISNLFSYLRNITSNSKSTLFKPSLGSFTVLSNSDTIQTPTIGTIVQHLIDFVRYYHEAKNTSTFLKLKLHDIPNMSHVDLTGFTSVVYDGIDIQIVRNEATEFVADKLVKKGREVAYAQNIIENALYLLWVHLDHYMLQAIPRIRHGEIADGVSFRGEVYGASEAMWNVTVNDIKDIKERLVLVFNENFSRQLLETVQGSTDVNKEFVEVLVRKIKRLLQFVPV